MIGFGGAFGDMGMYVCLCREKIVRVYVWGEMGVRGERQGVTVC